MFYLLRALLGTIRASMRTGRELALENLALRQQLAVLRRSTKRPKLTTGDRGFWLLAQHEKQRPAQRRLPLLQEDEAWSRVYSR